MLNQKKKILLIEDEVYVHDVYQEVLNEAGFEVTIATDGQEGLLKASQGGYDLILLDMMLPKMDGLSVLAALRNKLPLKPNGPVVMLTNLTHGDIIKDGLSLGAKGHLVKANLTPDQLVTQVKKFLTPID